MTDLSGKSIGRYHIIEQLGRGGMATVYKAYDTRLERHVAIKLIRQEAFPKEMHERMLKRFEREAKSLARLDHMYIVKVYDYGEYQGAPYLVLQYVPAGTLKDLTGKPVSWRDAAALLLPIARALAYAHQHGILHRDVKPSNILINEAGEPLLTDFGIAKMLEGEEAATLTGTGVGIGTPEYMAPEQGLGEEVDARTDVYALGVVFYELVTGNRPFQADTPLAVLYKQMNNPLPRPGNFVPELPEKVEAVLYKALAKQPVDRYANMTQFTAALASLAQDGQVEDERNEAETRVLAETQTETVAASPAEELQASEPPAAETVVRTPESEEEPVEKMNSESTRVVPHHSETAQPSRKGLPIWVWGLAGLLGLGVMIILLVLAFGGFGTRQEPTEAAVVMPPAQTATHKPVSTEAGVAEEPTSAADLGGIRVILITPNPLGDRSFIDAAARGVEKFREDYPNVQADILETNGVAEHEAALRGAIAKGYDMIIGLAIDPDLMFGLAYEFPDQLFGSASEIFAEELPPNMAAYVINVHESSFLVGVVVGMLTETKVVGAVVGGDSPSLNQFFYGYKQGVLEVCPDCTVLVSYLGFDFSNPTLGYESALAQYDEGADIIYQVAGRSGEGVLSAAAERDLYAIGVDSNQDDTQPGHVIVSSIKATDTTTYLLAEMAVNGFEQGFHQLGLSDGGAGLSWDYGSTTFEDNGPESMVSKLPDVKAKVEEYRTQILNGDLEVCDALNENPVVCDPLK